MEKLYEKFKDITLKDVLKIEESDRQFIALRKLYNNFSPLIRGDAWKADGFKQVYLSLVIANAIICYQLSGKWEDYWEEFSQYFSKNQADNIEIVDSLWRFIKQSKNNKRFIDTKIKRLEKLRDFLEEFRWKEKYFYENMLELRDLLAKIMNQKREAKTIVFAIKMFSYAARNIFDFIEYPEEIHIPIDSRLISLYEKYKLDYNNIDKFYLDLSEKLGIPLLHLDSIMWVNYEELK